MKLKPLASRVSRVSIFFFILGFHVAYAADYVSLSRSLPLIGTSWTTGAGLTSIINKLLGISVGFAAALAVIMLSIGGFKYMTSESVFNMGSAKEQITNAIVGLIIVLAAVLVLGYINPEIVSLNFFNA